MNPYEIAWATLNPTGYLIDQLKKNSANFEKKTESSARGELELESFRQEIRSRSIQDAAKAEQEIAIARRIQIAEEVEIEEYYDGEVSGNVGLEVKENSATLGASGSGRKIVKRVIKFKGFGKEVLVSNGLTVE